MFYFRRLMVDLVLPAALGALATLGFSAWHVYPATLAALIGLFPLWRYVGPVRAAWRGLVFGAVYFGLGLYAAHAAVSGAGAIPWSAIQALVLACFVALAGAVASATRRLAVTPWALAIVPAAWGLSELVCVRLCGGLAGLAPGYVTLAVPLNGLAPLIGVHGLTIALVLFAGALWLLYTGALFDRVIAAVLVAVLPVLFWYVPPASHWTHAESRRLSVAVLPGALEKNVAGEVEQPSHPLARYRDMSRRNDADLVVWPEVAATASRAQIQKVLHGLATEARHRNQVILAGLSRPKGCAGMVALGASWPRQMPCAKAPTATASQTRLVYSHGMASGFAQGSEALSAHRVSALLPAAGILINITGHARRSGLSQPVQPLHVARMRALEAGRPVVLASYENGSTLISFTGRILYRIPGGRIARLAGAITPRRGLTPYMRYGDRALWWGTAMVVLAGLFGALGVRRRRRFGRENFG